VSSRQTIRNEIRQQRRSLDQRQQAVAARRIGRRILALPGFRNARRIACYLANDGELDLSAVMARMRMMNKCCYLPVLDTLGSNRLWFAPFDDTTPLQVNSFGIPEPMVSPRRYLAAGSLDLIFMPLVAFDSDGNRLGMGGGFYDRSLAFLNRRHHWIRPRLYGIAHDFQRVSRLEHAPWDVPMHGIVTDQAIYTVKVRS